MLISGAKALVKALEREKEFISAILHNSYDGIAVVNSSGYIVLLSPGMKRSPFCSVEI